MQHTLVKLSSRLQDTMKGMHEQRKHSRIPSYTIARRDMITQGTYKRVSSGAIACHPDSKRLLVSLFRCGLKEEVKHVGIVCAVQLR